MLKSVKVKVKKFRNSMSLPELLEDLRLCQEHLDIMVFASKYANMHAIMQIYKYASTQVNMYASTREKEYASIRICKYPNMQI